MDEQTKIAALAQRYYEEEGRPEGKAEEHWLRAERELRGPTAPSAPETEPPPSSADRQIEEAMHLDR